MTNVRHSILALASFGLLTACGLAPEEKIAEAEASYAAHDYSAAKVYLVSALEDKPGDEQALLLLAKTYIAMGDGEGALRVLEKIGGAGDAGHIAPSKAEAQLLMGNFDEALATLGKPASADAARIAALAYLGKSDLAAAKAAIASGESLQGNKAGLLALRSQVELGEGRTEAALATAQAALKQDAESLDALLASARAHQAVNQLPATLAAYEKAAKIHPQSYAAAYGLVATLGDMGRYEDARAGLERLASLAPKSIEVTHLKARLAIAEGQFEKARELLQGVEADLRQNPSMQVTYATALLRTGQNGLARAWLEPLVKDYPGLREPRRLLAEAQLAGGDARSSLATIRGLAERPDARPEELAVAAKAAKRTGDPAAARFAARETKATPQWIGGELATADTALRNQQWRKAVTSYEAIAKRTTQPNAMVLNNLAFAKAQLGKNDEAIAIALKAVAIAPDHPAILDTAGWILVESGKDRARGITMLEKAAKLDPDNAAIARRLAQAKRG